MPFVADKVKKQIISLLDINKRNGSYERQYSLNIGDEGWIPDEINTAVDFACIEVCRTICETHGHSERGTFVSNESVTYGAELPSHIGDAGIPIITPYTGANTILGRRKSYEEIDSYRRNPETDWGKVYGDVNHDQEDGGKPSPLAGFYAIVDNRFYFTGLSATVPLAIADNTSTTIDKTPLSYEPTVLKLAMGNLAKDGTISSKFGYFLQLGMTDLKTIKEGKLSVPSVKSTIGTRDIGTK